jgi:hypothetical protein
MTLIVIHKSKFVGAIPCGCPFHTLNKNYYSLDFDNVKILVVNDNMTLLMSQLKYIGIND